MRKCLACGSSQLNVECDCCRWEPNQVDGFYLYAPNLADDVLGFDERYFAKLAQLEANNFWFRARNQLIIDMLIKYKPKFDAFFEVGCGTGYVLSGIADAFPGKRYCGGEVFLEGLRFARQRQKENIEFMQLDARYIPFCNEFDCVGMFDVLEHIDEDLLVLEQIHQALKSNGLMMITVPQHQWLWSKADAHACHVRRYSARDLHEKVKRAGFEILRSTSFVSLLLPMMMVSRALQSFQKKYDLFKELNLPYFINKTFEKILRFELYLISKNIDFRFGGSRLLIAKKL